MANPYDALVAESQPQAATPDDNPYDAIVADLKAQQQQRARAVFEKALAVNPDQAAEAQRLASQAGLPPETVERNLEEVRRKEQARMLDLARMAQDSPVLARQLVDPTFTKQTHDHVESLSALEQTFNVVRAVPAGAVRGLGSMVAGSGELIDIGARNIGLSAARRVFQDLTGLDAGVALDVAGSLKFSGQGWKMLADVIGPDKEAQNFATDVAGGIGQLLQQIGVQLATGGTASLVSLFSQGADAMADKTRNDSSAKALQDAAVITGASITALTEKYGVDALLNRVPPAIKNSALRWVADKLVAGGIEATQEITEGVLQDIVRVALTNSEAKIGEGAGYEASVAGTSAAIVRAALGVRVRSTVEEQRAKEAEREAERLQEQLKLAASALLRERNPEQFRGLMQEMAANTEGAHQEIYVDAGVLNQLAPEVLNQLPESVLAQLNDQVTQDTPISIPVADVLTVAPGTPLEQVLVENARVNGPDSLTQLEAKQAGEQAQQFLAQKAERVIAQAADQQAMQESSDRVKQGILDQLNTVGRFRKEVNDAYATWTAAFYTTMAGRLGITPEEMAARYPLRIAGQTGQGDTLKAGKVGEIAVEGYHFSKEDRPTISTALFGTGLEGSGREQFLNAADARLRKRSYWYVDKGTGINPEAGVGGRGHRAQLTNIYDGDADPLRLRGPDFESKVLDAGFSGYLSRLEGTQSGQVILLGDQTVTPEVLGSLGKTTGKVVPAPAARESKGRDVVADALRASKSLPIGQMTLEDWSKDLARLMPEAHAQMAAAGVFDGEGKFYKDGLIKRFEDLTPAETYAQSLPSRWPTSKKATPSVDDPMLADLETLRLDQEQLEKAIAAVAAEPGMRTKARKPDAKLEQMIDKMVDNLLWLHDQIPAEIRERSKKWYDGARAIADNWSIKYGKTRAQTAGILAVLSPQKDWFMNVTMGERVLDILSTKMDHKFDDKMRASAFQFLLKDLQKPEDKRENTQAFEAIKDKTLGEVVAGGDMLQIGIWMRAYDEAYHSGKHAVIHPEGEFGDNKTKDDGEETTRAWGGFDALGKAASIFVDGSAENINEKLGGEHKVRNFYNNIFEPNDPRFATIDTHAVAAALLRPLAGSDKPVADNFGATGGTNMTGVSGTYPIYFEAYKRAAEARGILPREMQSITWEAIRGLYKPGFKGKKENLKAINDLWKMADQGKVTVDEARRQLSEAAGGIEHPDWWDGKEGKAPAVEDKTYVPEREPFTGTKVTFEVAPDPNNEELTNRWNALPAETRLQISKDLGWFAAGRTLAHYNSDTIKGELHLQTGGYLNETNPSLSLWMNKYASMVKVQEVARILGYVLDQDSMMVTSPKKFKGGETWGTVIIEGVNAASAKTVYDELRANVLDENGQPLIQGHTTGNSMVILVPKEQATTIGQRISDYLGDRHNVYEDEIHVAWPEKGADGYGFSGQEETGGDRSGPSVRKFADQLRAETARQLEQRVADEEQRAGGAERTDAGTGSDQGVLKQEVSAAETALSRWFGTPGPDNNLVNEDGTPMVLYHGTSKGAVKALKSGSPFQRSKTGAMGPAVYLGDSAEASAGYNAGAMIQVYARGKYLNNERWSEYVSKHGWAGAEAAARADGYAGVYDRKFENAIAVWDPANIKAVDAADFAETNGIYEQGPRGTFNPSNLELALNENANLSTFLHETGHFFLEVMVDLANQPNAPADIQQDMAALLKWFGVSDPATWQGYTLDQKRKYHERFAESFEQYLLEGKAPSTELQPLFRKFRAWMLNVYRSLKSFIDNTPDSGIVLSDEIRQVFDRMLATEAQIQQAEEVAGLLPNEDATNAALEKLTARSLRDLKWTVNARAKAIKELQKQAATLRKGVEAEVRATVEAQPLYRAIRWLKKGEMTDEAGNQIKAEKGFRLDTEALATMYPETALANPDLTKLKGMTGKNGLHPDIVADMFGFESGDALVRSLVEAEPIQSVVEGMTDQRMLEEHGDLVDQRAIEEAANEAVHNEARAKSLATELKAQAEALNPRTDTGQTNAKGSKITVNALVEAAKQFAANVVARTPLRDLKNKAWQHTAAERRASKRWQEATAAGKTAEAIQAKQDQMLNHAAAKAAIEAQAEMRKILEFFRRVVKDGNEKTVEKGRDPDVVNAARAILGAYGVVPKGAKTALEYMALVEKNDPAMFAALQPSMQGALNMAQPLDALTMDELRGLHEEIQAMWHLAKRSRQMEVDGNLMDIEDAETELQDRMQELGVPDTMPGDTGAITPKQELARKLQHAMSLLRRVEQWAQGMGNAFTKLVFQPVKDAADRYRADRVKYRKAYQTLVDQVAPHMPKGKIAAPELGYTFGEGHNGIGMAELLHAILHTGNDSNKRKLLLGRKWATENADGTLDTSRWDAFIARLIDEGTLRKEHYEFAQGVWDLLEKTKPLAQKTHRDVFGRYFAEVTANEVVTPFGTYRGGYVPAQADPRIVQDADLRKLAELENENMSFSFPGTNKGFTKGRVEYNRPLMLDLRTIGQHVDKVLLFSHMEPAVRDVNKLLSRKGVSYSLGRIDPTVYAGMLTPWLNRSARQIVETPTVGDGGISRVLSAARSRAGMALMFANVSNTIQQITGFSLAALKVKPASMTRAAAQFVAHPKDTAKAVADASTFMANRMENEVAAINDAMDDILLDASLYEKAQAWSRRHAYFLQTAMANTMEPIIWTAAYNDALAEGQSEKEAVRHADSVIRTTQGSTLPEDVSRIETGPAYARIFTQFVGYFNMMANTNATELKKIAGEEGLKKGAGKALYVVTLGMLMPLWIAEAVAQAMRGGPDDEDRDGYLDDWLAAVIGMGTIKGSLAMVPFVGQLANAGLNRLNDNPADDKISLSPAVSLLESSVGNVSHIYKAITGDADKINMRNAVRDVASAVSIATGLPAVAVARPLGYLAGVADDKIDPTGPVDMARGLVSGTPSPGSK